jgi:hypothetical protein
MVRRFPRRLRGNRGDAGQVATHLGQIGPTAMNDPHGSVVRERTRNHGVLIGLGVTAGVLLLVFLGFLVAGSGRNAGTNQTNVNLPGQGQPGSGQQPSALQININMTVQAQASMTTVATGGATLTVRPTSQPAFPAPTESPVVEVVVITATEPPTPSLTASLTPSPTPSPTESPTPSRSPSPTAITVR